MDVSKELKLKWSWTLVSEETLASSEMEVEFDIVSNKNIEVFLFVFYHQWWE